MYQSKDKIAHSDSLGIAHTCYSKSAKPMIL